MIPAYPNMVDPEAVDVEDSDEDGPGRDARETHMGALGSFGTKLIRRLSHRADPKANVRSSAGASDEELARRAELKRLMHKRIQEELKSEEEEEEDFRPTSLGQSSIGNGKDAELPGGGPRDTIEFSVSGIDEEEAGKDVGTLSEILPSPAPVTDQQRGLHQHRIGYSEPTQKSADGSHHGSNWSPIEPLSPSCLTPVHLSGEDGCKSPSAASWRLSYSTIHIESYIGPLVETRQDPPPSLENSFPKDNDDTTHASELGSITGHSNPTMGGETIDSTDQTIQTRQGLDTERPTKESDDFSHLLEATDGRYSPLDVWLRSQDMRYASIFTSRPNSEMASDQHESNKNKQTEGPQRPESFLNLSRRRNQATDLSLDLHVRAPESYPKAPKRLSERENPPITTPSDESIALERALVQMGNVYRPKNLSTGDQAQDTSSRYTSSRYTTRSNSQQNTPSGSRLSLTDILGHRRSLQPPVPVYSKCKLL